MSKIYLDYASTTPVDPRVLEAMRPFFCDQFGNASSSHAFGREARQALEEARETLARFIGAKPGEIIFNSGGTEGNNHAVFGVAKGLRDSASAALATGRRHIIVSSLEHHSVEEPVAFLEREGYRVTSLGVSAEGLVDPQEVKAAIADETVLIAVMHANNEIGTIQPIEEIGKIAREKNIPFLVDAVQTVGHIPVNVETLGADFLSLSSHKLYGPKGVGALYVRGGRRLPSLLLGGDQERGRRASTENVAGIVGLASAVDLCARDMPREIEIQSSLRDRLLEEIPKRIEGVKINGHRTRRLPNNAHFSFAKVDGESLLLSLDMAGMAASMGSACASGAMEPSRVLRAIGLSDEWAHGALRITIGRWTTQEQIDHLLDQIPFIVKSLRI